MVSSRGGFVVALIISSAPPAYTASQDLLTTAQGAFCMATPPEEWSEACLGWAQDLEAALRSRAPAAFAAREAAWEAVEAAVAAVEEDAPAAFLAREATEIAWRETERALAEHDPEMWAAYGRAQADLLDATRALHRTSEWRQTQVHVESFRSGQMDPEVFYPTVEALRSANPQPFDAESGAAGRLAAIEDELRRRFRGAWDAWQTAFSTHQAAIESLRLAAPKSLEAEEKAWEVMRSADTTLRLIAPEEYAAWRMSLQDRP